MGEEDAPSHQKRIWEMWYKGECKMSFVLQDNYLSSICNESPPRCVMIERGLVWAPSSCVCISYNPIYVYIIPIHIPCGIVYRVALSFLYNGTSTSGKLDAFSFMWAISSPLMPYVRLLRCYLPDARDSHFHNLASLSFALSTLSIFSFLRPRSIVFCSCALGWNQPLMVNNWFCSCSMENWFFFYMYSSRTYFRLINFWCEFGSSQLINSTE